jgi:predicted TIM-barrel fold metal-dependent hydrolase
MDVAFRAFEELGMVVGIHGLTSTPAPPPGPLLFSPGQYILKANELEPMRALASQPTSFWYECMAWTAQILMSGFFDRYPKLKMAMFECNASWIPQLLESCDRLFDIYKNERLQPAKRKPSEAFYDQCIIGFESDEIDVLRQWDRFENIAVWASDTYHWDGSDAWTAIKEMSELEVPEPVQAKLMGANAAQRYGIPQKMLVREAPSKLDHPSWVPREDDPSLDEWWEKETHPRKYSGVQHTSTPRGGY